MTYVYMAHEVVAYIVMAYILMTYNGSGASIVRNSSRLLPGEGGGNLLRVLASSWHI